MDEAANRSTLPILAIDLGGTRIRAAIVESDLGVSHRRSVATDAADGPAAVIDRICQLAAEVLADAQRDDLPRPAGIGISAPGPLDARRGVVLSPPNLPGWHDVPLAEAVARATGLPAFLERDTNVAVMAEWQHGAARGSDDAVYVTVSTGIGGGIVLGGRPLIGLDGTAGEIGHLTVELDGPLCGDGMPGHVEALGSGAAIAREGRALLARGGSPGLAALAVNAAAVDAELVARAADGGDAACASVLARAWIAIGAMCAGLVNVLNPEVIVLGGSIALRRPELRTAVREQIDRRAFSVPAARVRVEMAEHADDVSLIGWLPIVHQRLHDPLYRKEGA
ncbi:MAG TPA: ROK family protein [Candidatus Limnocylindria bacterium]|nr:ROK family protein [Candidatus Limnocylindria bacterium]